MSKKEYNIKLLNSNGVMLLEYKNSKIQHISSNIYKIYKDDKEIAHIDKGNDMLLILTPC